MRILIKLSFAFLVGIALASMPNNSAFAANYACNDANYGASIQNFDNGIDGGYSYNDTVCTSQQPGTIVVAEAALRVATRQITRQISDRINDVTSDTKGGFSVSSLDGQNLTSFKGSTGVASGDYLSGLGAWVSGSWKNLEDENTSTAFDGDAYSILVGADFSPYQNVLLGLSAGYESIDLDTQFNRNTVTGQDGEVEGDGYTIAPYALYQFDQNVSFQASAGYSWIDYESLRFDQVNQAQITGETDSTRWFTDIGVNYKEKYDVWKFRSNLNWLYASEEKDGFTETSNIANVSSSLNQAELTTLLSQARLGAEVGYDWNGIEPYVKAVGEYDIAKSDHIVSNLQIDAADDDFGADVGGGIRFLANDQISGGIEGTTHLFRDDYTEYTLQGNIRVNF